MNGPADSISFPLPASTAAPSLARREVARWLQARHVSTVTSDDILLVVSELVTNAVDHASSPPLIEVRHQDGRVRVAVRDREVTGPAVRSGGSGGGFGLQIVQRAARRWGWEPTDDGKVVWAEIDDGA